VARTILFLPAGPDASLGSIALHRAQSVEGSIGLRGGAVALVERSSHCGARADDESLTLEMWRSHWTVTTWREYLGAGEMESRLAVIRQRTHTGRPLGSAEFVQDLEKATQRRLALQKRGPREKIVMDRRQGELTLDP
jgi:hypothetical protein